MVGKGQEDVWIQGLELYEKDIRAQNWLRFGELFLWQFDRERTWGFMVLIGKSKGLTWGEKEGQERNLQCSRLYKQYHDKEKKRKESDRKNNKANMPQQEKHSINIG